MLTMFTLNKRKYYMRAVVWEDKDVITVKDIPDIIPGDEIIVKVLYAGICGSDLMILSGNHPTAVPPLVLGHEFMGTIYYVPKRYNDRFKTGQRVVVNPLISCKICKPCLNGYEHVCKNLKLLGIGHGPGAFTEYTSVPMAERIHQVPDNVTDQEAALTEPLAVAVHAVEQAEVSYKKTALVIGAGPIGLLIALVLKARGVERIWLSEIDNARIKRAENLGFPVINSVEHDLVAEIGRLTGTEMVDVIFDVAGVPQTACRLIPLCAIKGRIVIVAINKKPASILLRDLTYKELTIMGNFIYKEKHFPDAIQLLSQKKIDVKPLISHIFTIKDAKKAFDTAKGGKEACKILFSLQRIL